MPSTRRSVENFDDHFTREGLDDLVKFRRNQERISSRKKLEEEVNEVLGRDEDIKSMVDDIIKCCQEYQQNKTLTDSDISALVSCINIVRMCCANSDSVCSYGNASQKLLS